MILLLLEFVDLELLLVAIASIGLIAGAVYEIIRSIREDRNIVSLSERVASLEAKFDDSMMERIAALEARIDDADRWRLEVLELAQRVTKLEIDTGEESE